jgi:hypothetical protein
MNKEAKLCKGDQLKSKLSQLNQLDEGERRRYVERVVLSSEENIDFIDMLFILSHFPEKEKPFVFGDCLSKLNFDAQMFFDLVASAERDIIKMLFIKEAKIQRWSSLAEKFRQLLVYSHLYYKLEMLFVEGKHIQFTIPEIH